MEEELDFVEEFSRFKQEKINERARYDTNQDLFSDGFENHNTNHNEVEIIDLNDDGDDEVDPIVRYSLNASAMPLESSLDGSTAELNDEEPDDPNNETDNQVILDIDKLPYIRLQNMGTVTWLDHRILVGHFEGQTFVESQKVLNLMEFIRDFTAPYSTLIPAFVECPNKNFHWTHNPLTNRRTIVFSTEQLFYLLEFYKEKFLNEKKTANTGTEKALVEEKLEAEMILRELLLEHAPKLGFATLIDAPSDSGNQPELEICYSAKVNSIPLHYGLYQGEIYVKAHSLVAAVRNSSKVGNSEHLNKILKEKMIQLKERTKNIQWYMNLEQTFTVLEHLYGIYNEEKIIQRNIDKTREILIQIADKFGYSGPIPGKFGEPKTLPESPEPPTEDVTEKTVVVKTTTKKRGRPAKSSKGKEAVEINENGYVTINDIILDYGYSDDNTFFGSTSLHSVINHRTMFFPQGYFNCVRNNCSDKKNYTGKLKHPKNLVSYEQVLCVLEHDVYKEYGQFIRNIVDKIHNKKMKNETEFVWERKSSQKEEQDEQEESEESEEEEEEEKNEKEESDEETETPKKGSEKFVSMETVDNFVVKETKIHYGFNNRFLYVYANEVLKLLELSLDNPLKTIQTCLVGHGDQTVYRRSQTRELLLSGKQAIHIVNLNPKKVTQVSDLFICTASFFNLEAEKSENPIKTNKLPSQISPRTPIPVTNKKLLVTNKSPVKSKSSMVTNSNKSLGNNKLNEENKLLTMSEMAGHAIVIQAKPKIISPLSNKVNNSSKKTAKSPVKPTKNKLNSKKSEELRRKTDKEEKDESSDELVDSTPEFGMSGTESDKSEDEIETASSPKKQKVMTVTPSDKKPKRTPRAEKVDPKFGGYVDINPIRAIQHNGRDMRYCFIKNKPFFFHNDIMKQISIRFGPVIDIPKKANAEIYYKYLIYSKISETILMEVDKWLVLMKKNKEKLERKVYKELKNKLKQVKGKPGSFLNDVKLLKSKSEYTPAHTSMKEENPVELDDLSSFSIDGVEYWYGWNSGVAYFYHTPITTAALNFSTKVDLKLIIGLIYLCDDPIKYSAIHYHTQRLSMVLSAQQVMYILNKYEYKPIVKRIKNKVKKIIGEKENKSSDESDNSGEVTKEGKSMAEEKTPLVDSGDEIDFSDEEVGFSASQNPTDDDLIPDDEDHAGKILPGNTVKVGDRLEGTVVAVTNLSGMEIYLVKLGNGSVLTMKKGSLKKL